MKKLRKEIIEGSLILGVASVLFFTGAYVQVVAQVQRVVLASGLVRPDINKANLTESVPFAEDLQLLTLDGKKAKLSDYRGKVVFMNFGLPGAAPVSQRCLTYILYIRNLKKKKVSLF